MTSSAVGAIAVDASTRPGQRHLRGMYRCIVADPPWPYPKGDWGRLPGGQGCRAAERRGENADTNVRNGLPYQTMSLAEIAALPVRDYADPDGCHIYLWTTNKFLPDSFAILKAWGFRYSQSLVWAKKPMGIAYGGAFSQSCEYVLFGRRGTLSAKERVDSTWFPWPRMDRQHSRKPDGFYELAERVSPGPYLELFARRKRLGWDAWGNEVESDIELVA